MEGLGVLLVVAATLMAPFAVYVLWRSVRRVREVEPVVDEVPVDRSHLRERLNKGVELGEEQVRQREATGATPLPNFYRGRHRVTVERDEPRRYM